MFTSSAATSGNVITLQARVWHGNGKGAQTGRTMSAVRFGKNEFTLPMNRGILVGSLGGAARFSFYGVGVDRARSHRFHESSSRQLAQAGPLRSEYAFDSPHSHAHAGRVWQHADAAIATKAEREPNIVADSSSLIAE